jgi:hypothetical protein
MLKTYSLKHNLNAGKFLFAYMAILNSIIRDIWNTIEWEEKAIEGKKQRRLIPHYKKDKVMKSYSGIDTLRTGDILLTG